ncbi:MAG: filamentous hemagglutinin family outer membrane protein [Anaerolineaceae bacterium]|nr:MAG: filamentous hemagglutinin family outer membrane protein [Anaerolineaceae bacterium]
MSAIRFARPIKLVGILLVLFLLAAAFGCSPAPATPPSLDGNLSIWYVATTGSDTLNTCHTAQSPCKTIYWAVSHAYNGAVIHIADGVYSEHLWISVKGIKLQGSGPNTILENTGSMTLGGVIRIECPNCYSLVSISDLTIRNGTAEYGGAIYAADVELTMKNVTIQNSTAGSGGGIFITETSTVKLDNVTIEGCTTTYTPAVDGGGGIYNRGTLTITNSTLKNNTAASSGGGLYNLGKVNISASLFEKNTAENFGGGIFNYNPGDLTMTTSTLTKNDGGIAGGGLNNNGGKANVSASTFDNNTAGTGGGIMNMNYALLSIADVTISGNTADYGGGGIANGSADSTLYAASLTIAYNKAPQGGGFYQMGGDHMFINTIFAFNQGGDCNTVGLTGGINIVSDSTCGFTGYGSRYNVDPMLLPLIGNGGPTETHALSPSSVAIDTGTNWLCPLTDQRGAPRGVDGNGDGVPRDDVGAFEFGTSVMSLTLDVPIVTATPGRGIFTFQEPGNCRSGPNIVYPALTSAPIGTAALVEGRNMDGSWYRIQLNGILCWVSAGIGLFDGDPFALPIREAPPTPTPTEVPPVTVVCSDYTNQSSCEAHPECYWQPFADVAGGTCRNK